MRWGPNADWSSGTSKHLLPLVGPVKHTIWSHEATSTTSTWAACFSAFAKSASKACRRPHRACAVQLRDS
eukprot:5692865-Lingulodinium_polyedra.AAC.1